MGASVTPKPIELGERRRLFCHLNAPSPLSRHADPSIDLHALVVSARDDGLVTWPMLPKVTIEETVVFASASIVAAFDTGLPVHFTGSRAQCAGFAALFYGTHLGSPEAEVRKMVSEWGLELDDSDDLTRAVAEFLWGKKG